MKQKLYILLLVIFCHFTSFSQPFSVDAGPANTTFCSNAISSITAVATTTTTNGFQGVFAPSNWTLSNNNTNGSINASGAPSNIIFTSLSDDSQSITGDTSYTITNAVPMTVSFNWAVTAPFYSSRPLPTVIVNGVGSFLQGYGTGLYGPLVQSGTMTVSVPAGQNFGFKIINPNSYNRVDLTISNLVITNGANYSWVATNGGSITGTSNTASVTPATSGIYNVTATNVYGVTATDNVVVTINPVPTAPTASAQSFCGSATIGNLIPAASSAIK